ncbi:MAG: hypothetical protein JO264_13510 [Acidisphaera sp.]|nr:hypothetical protein [Acidisphaera sp.]
MSGEHAPATETARALRLAALLASRLCHDVSGLLGTMMGALDLAQDDPEMAGEALPLAGEASQELAQRLRLLRAAWGATGEPLGLPALQELAEGMPARRRVSLDLAGLREGAGFAPEPGRLVLNLLLLASESLPGGGRLALTGDPGREIVVAIEGPRAAWASGLAKMLIDPDAAWEMLDGARTVQAPLTVLLARAAGLRLRLLLPGGPAEAERPPPLLASFAAE